MYIHAHAHSKILLYTKLRKQQDCEKPLAVVALRVKGKEVQLLKQWEHMPFCLKIWLASIYMYLMRQIRIKRLTLYHTGYSYG